MKKFYYQKSDQQSPDGNEWIIYDSTGRELARSKVQIDAAIIVQALKMVIIS